MAGAMRRMGIYLGLVEDDDTRGYGRYDTRLADHPEHDRRYGRYADDPYEGQYGDAQYPTGNYVDDIDAAALAPARDPEPLSVRRVAPARPLQAWPPPAAPRPVVPAAVRASARCPAATPPWRRGRQRRDGQRAGRRHRGEARRPRAGRGGGPGARGGTEPYRITTLHPRTYNEARTIGERFRDGMPVIMNLTEMDDADAERLVDFAAGLSFGLRGSIERVTAKVFLLSPQNVDVTAEDKARIRESGFFNQS